LNVLETRNTFHGTQYLSHCRTDYIILVLLGIEAVVIIIENVENFNPYLLNFSDLIIYTYTRITNEH